MSINTDHSVTRTATQIPQITEQKGIGYWIHRHPTTAKIIQIACLVLAMMFLIQAPFIASSRIFAAYLTVGIVLSLASIVSLCTFDIFFPPHHDMKNHVYQPGQCEGGMLYYNGDVPILLLEADDPFKAGKAHGYLCGDAINRVTKRLSIVFNLIVHLPPAQQLSKTLADIRQTIPERYLLEMRGLVAGYNQWAKEQSWWKSVKPLTEDDVLLLHLFPDVEHFEPFRVASKVAQQDSQRKIALACSAIIERDPQRGMVFARNLDWASCGVLGTYSLITNRRYTNGSHNTVEVGFPGFIGTLTGMNDGGLSVAMNVCIGTTNTIRGMPAALYNRACLEECASVEEVENFVNRQNPLGAYHLTVADSQRAESIHFYQGSNQSHTIRSYENEPLCTLNFCYDPNPHTDINRDFSTTRQRHLESFFKQRNNLPIENALTLPIVNNWETNHAVVMEPRTKTIRVAFNNAFAASSPLHSVPTEDL